jgi:hypothetical protein
MNQLGGHEYFPAIIEEDCKSQCILTPGCTGVDWNTGKAQNENKCWFSGSWSTGNNTLGAEAINHWELTKTGPECSA